MHVCVLIENSLVEPEGPGGLQGRAVLVVAEQVVDDLVAEHRGRLGQQLLGGYRLLRLPRRLRHIHLRRRGHVRWCSRAPSVVPVSARHTHARREQQLGGRVAPLPPQSRAFKDRLADEIL